jgi:hypothetical protein
MADDSHGLSPPIPTAIAIHEPEFPSPPPDPHDLATHHASVSSAKSSHHPHHASSTDLPTMMGSTDSGHGQDEKLQPFTVGGAECHPISLPRPSVHKFATEQPVPAAVRQDPVLQRTGSVGERLPHLERPNRLNFDPYMSDSSSSSSDDDDDDVEKEKQNRERTDNNKEAKREQAGNTRRGSASKTFSRLKINNENVNTKGKVSKRDGRLRLTINETLNSGYIAKTLGAGIRKHFGGVDDEGVHQSGTLHDTGKIALEDDIMEDPKRRIRLNIVVIVIGSRGDIQPFLRIGKILKEDYGHRVRIATHPAFKQFVEKDSGLEFFSIGGDPSELMAFMVKNPGLIPNLETVKDGEIGKRRAAMFEMFEGMWRACINATDDETDEANLKMSKHT